MRTSLLSHAFLLLEDVTKYTCSGVCFMDMSSYDSLPFSLVFFC